MLLQKIGFNLWVRAPLFFGEKIWILTGETISHGLLGFGYAESALTSLMLEVLKPGMRVVDVGAHLGYEALLAGTLVGTHGRVVSFEPQQHIAKWTARNLERFTQCRVVESAVGETCGSLDFSVMDILTSAFSGAAVTATGGHEVKVPVTTLPAALRDDERPVDFLKCDVEGGEMSVLRGAQEILRQDQPLLVLEAEMPSSSSSRPRINEFADFLEPFGYVGFMFDFDGQFKVGRIGSLNIGHANVGFVPRSRLEFAFLNPA